VQTITIACRKGGAGKTTIARNLAVEAERQGAGPVAMLDADAMRGLAQWWESRKAEVPMLAALRQLGDKRPLQRGELAAAVQKLQAAGYRLCLIDTAPEAGPIVEEAIGLADLVLVPVNASPDDLRAIHETLAIVETVKAPKVFVVNHATRRATLTGLVAVKLSQHGTVAETTIHRAEVFKQSAIEGLGVQEMEPSGVPAQEIEGLWTYVAGRLRLAAGLPYEAPTEAPRKRGIELTTQVGEQPAAKKLRKRAS
jgi:chromosome partitioning protein